MGAKSISLRELQKENAEWVAMNFPDSTATEPMLGLVEEVGELAHAFLKGRQGIRYTREEAGRLEQDAIGDILEYLAHFCTARGYDLERVVAETHEKVMKRRWRA